MSAEVIGRTGELESIDRFLEALGDGPAVLVLEGPPGIGKTALVRAAVEAARGRGARVLSCTAGVSETRLAYAGLADLLRRVDPDLLERLPDPQREALDAALLRSGPAGEVDRRAVATAVLSVIEALAADGVVLLAIDDAQWLDGSTAHVIDFCARRLPGPIGLVVSRRVGEVSWVSGLARFRPTEVFEILPVGPLAAGELQRMLGSRLPEPLDRRTADRVHKATGGNPFYALELARGLPAGAPPSPTLPLPASLDEVVSAHIARLEPGVEEVLLAIASLADPTVEALERVLGAEAVYRLDAAEQIGMVELRGTRVRFTHPLLAGGVYAAATTSGRRDMHRRLSEAVVDVEERARHLAYAGMPEALGALDEAARHVAARGAPDAAAELLELALGLGAGNDVRVRAAEHHFDAGAPKRARALLEEAVATLPPGHEKARALILLAEVRYRDDSFPAALELLEHAHGEAGGDAQLCLMIDVRITFVMFGLGRVADAAAPSQAALRRAQRLGDPGPLGQALAVSAMIDYLRGHGIDEQRLAEAYSLERSHEHAGSELRPSLILAFIRLWTGRLDEAREAIRTAIAGWSEAGAHALARGSLCAVWVECWSGDVSAAETLKRDHSEQLFLLDTTVGAAVAYAARAMVEAYTGRVEEARRSCQESIALFERSGWFGAMIWPTTTLGFLEMSVGAVQAAATLLGPLAARALADGLAEPTAGGALFTGDAAEALIAVGRIPEAEAIVALLEQRGAEMDRPWVIAVGARCRALLLAAAGDVEEAETVLQRALEAHARLPMPLERGRTLLALGRVRRRLGHRLAAKEALSEALSVFEAVRSPRWAAQASAEIDGLGLRPRVSDALTPSEERVARLAASGLTNQQVAASLIVSPKTVEAHLSRAYRKLGIRSRAELGAHMGRR